MSEQIEAYVRGRGTDSADVARAGRGSVAGRGDDRVVLTCDDDNDASSTVIERCGGVLDPDRPKTETTSPKRRYWIG